MGNLLLEDVEYQVEQTRGGAWRRYVYADGSLFAEYKSRARLFGLPLVHHTRGKCPETGSRIVARGVLATGRLAIGVVAIGQASLGVIAIGQLGLGLVIGVGQASTGVLALGQLAMGGLFGLGQVAVGYVAIGQFGVGTYILAQGGVGQHVWSTSTADPAAVEFFKSVPRFLGLIE